MLHWLQNLATYWYLLGWRAAVEIAFFASLWFYTVRWLRADRQNNLVLWFYGYSFAACGAHVLNLPIISQFLFLFAPVAVMLFVLVHQQTLQRNFIAAKNITPARPTHDWLSEFMSALLAATHKNKPVICVIEKTDALRTMLASPLTFHTPIQKNLLDILLSSAVFEPHKMVWINHHGQLIAINATWHELADSSWFSDEVHDMETWKQDAVLLTNKTDALVFKISPQRTVDLIAQHKMIEQVTINEALVIIKHYLFGKDWQASIPSKHYDTVKHTTTIRSVEEQR